MCYHAVSYLPTFNLPTFHDTGALTAFVPLPSVLFGACVAQTHRVYGFVVVLTGSCAPEHNSWDGIMGDLECQKALVAKLLGYLVILGSLTVKAPQVCAAALVACGKESQSREPGRGFEGWASWAHRRIVCIS